MSANSKSSTCSDNRIWTPLRRVILVWCVAAIFVLARVLGSLKLMRKYDVSLSEVLSLWLKLYKHHEGTYQWYEVLLREQLTYLLFIFSIAFLFTMSMLRKRKNIVDQVTMRKRLDIDDAKDE